MGTQKEVERDDLMNAGIELETHDLDGWAVYSGCEGEVANFRGFFASKDDAETFADAKYTENGKTFDVGDPVCSESIVVPALLTEYGIFTANDYRIQSHKRLRSKVKQVTA